MKKYNPDYQHAFYSDEDNLALVTNFYPEWLPLYHGFKYVIQRIDLLRLMYLHRFGGVYADLDMECLRPLDELLNGRTSVLVTEPNDNFIRVNNLVPNYVMAFEKEAPFLAKLLKSFLTHPVEYTGHKVTDVLNITGPLKLTHFRNRFLSKHRHAPELLSSQLFSPLTHRELLTIRKANDKVSLQDPKLSGSYRIHHFHGSWL